MPGGSSSQVCRSPKPFSPTPTSAHMKPAAVRALAWLSIGGNTICRTAPPYRSVSPLPLQVHHMKLADMCSLAWLSIGKNPICPAAPPARSVPVLTPTRTSCEAAHARSLAWQSIGGNAMCPAAPPLRSAAGLGLVLTVRVKSDRAVDPAAVLLVCCSPIPFGT